MYAYIYIYYIYIYVYVYVSNVFPSEVGCQSYITNSTSVFLTNLGFPPSDERKYIKKFQDQTLSASVWIWQSHRVTSIQQCLVVSSVTAWVLWVRGKDASALKPCLDQSRHLTKILLEAILIYKH